MSWQPQRFLEHIEILHFYLVYKQNTQTQEDNLVENGGHLSQFSDAHTTLTP